MTDKELNQYQYKITSKKLREQEVEKIGKLEVW